MKKIIVNGIEISIETINNEYYLSLTDIAKKKSLAEPRNVISSWLSSINTINFLACWEEINNPSFNKLAFKSIEDEKERLFLTPEDWINRTNSIGLISKSGYLGDVYANSSIAFEFAHWISLEFKLHLIKEYQNLNIDTPKISLNTPNNTIKEIDTNTHNNAVKEIDTNTHNNTVKEIDANTHNNVVKEIDTNTHKGSLDKLENQSKNTNVETKVEPSDLKSSIESKFNDGKPSTLKMIATLFFLTGNFWMAYLLRFIFRVYNTLVFNFIGDMDFTLVDAAPITSVLLFIAIVGDSIVATIIYYFNTTYIDKYLYPDFYDIKNTRYKMAMLELGTALMTTFLSFKLFISNPDVSYDLLYAIAIGCGCYSLLYFFQRTDKEYIYYNSLATRDEISIKENLFKHRAHSFLIALVTNFILFLIFYSTQLTAIYG